jgi:ankyrin repeat protein
MSSSTQTPTAQCIADEEQTTSFSCLPPHLQSLILAYSGASLSTCKAAAAIISDAPLLATWLRISKSFAFMRASLIQRWDVCRHLLSSGYAASEPEFQLALVYVAGSGQLQLVNTLLGLVQLPPGPTKEKWESRWSYSREEQVARKPDLYEAVNQKHPLCAAAAGGHLEVCRVLLAAGVGPVTARSAMCEAAKSGHLEVLQLIESWGVPGSEQVIIALTPLGSAAKGGDLATVRYLIDKALQAPGPWKDARVISDVVVSCNGSYEILQHLMERQLQWADWNWTRALTSAAEGGDVRSVQLLLPKLPPCVRSGDPFRNEGTHPLQSAASKGHVEVMQLLRDEGMWSERRRDDALMDAAETGQVSAMKLLVQWGASINGTYKVWGCGGPLGESISRGHLPAVQWLLEQGAAISNLALVSAVRCSHIPAGAILLLCRILLQHGAQDPHGHALFEAARCGYEEVVQLLLNPGSDAPQTPNEHRFRWEVALCGAASMGRVEVVRDLLQVQSTVHTAPATAAEPALSSSTPPPSPADAQAEAVQSSAQSAIIAIQGSLANSLSQAVAAAQLGKGYRRPDHPRCRWPACNDDRFGDLDWLHEVMEGGYGHCKAACDCTAVVQMLVAAGAQPT